jgi:hypothetical protein
MMAVVPASRGEVTVLPHACQCISTRSTAQEAALVGGGACGLQDIYAYLVLIRMNMYPTIPRVSQMRNQKLRLLRQLSESEILSSLPRNALKVYVLQLVSARQIGREEAVEVQLIRRVLGGDLTRRDLLKIATALRRCGLAALGPSLRQPKSAGGDGTLRFRLMDLGQRAGHGGRKTRVPRAGRG